jgi:hypothetical protein
MRKAKGGEGNGGFERGAKEINKRGTGRCGWVRRLWQDMEGRHLKYTGA